MFVTLPAITGFEGGDSDYQHLRPETSCKEIRGCSFKGINTGLVCWATVKDPLAPTTLAPLPRLSTRGLFGCLPRELPGQACHSAV